MQLDNITKIIESMTVSQFRTLCLEYLNLLGYSESSLTDGPYDGTKDYKILTSRICNLFLLQCQLLQIGKKS